MMAETLARDLTDAGVEVLLPSDGDADPWESWRRLGAEADFLWPIAPETGGILERAAAEAVRPALVSQPSALAIARSKYATSRHLAAAGIRVVPSFLESDPLPASATGWVVKPDDGAGADETRFTKNPEPRAGAVAQPFLPGRAASFSMLAQEGKAWLLSCNLQEVDCRDGVFSYRGGVVGGAEERRAEWTGLAEAIAASLPGLRFYAGVDLIETEAGPVVLEINPRLTTSYVGLRDSLGLNPAALVLGLLEQPLSALIRPLAPRAVTVRVPR